MAAAAVHSSIDWLLVATATKRRTTRSLTAR